MSDLIEIRPITLDEWLPDRCLNGIESFDPKNCSPEAGCLSFNCFGKQNRESLIHLYESIIIKYGGCGFVAWDKNKIVAYNNFFPKEDFKRMKLYGYGCDSNLPEKTLVHNCLTIIKGGYLRKGISSRLIEESLAWGKANSWHSFEVHSVLPDCEKGWQSSQKGCLSFWERFGFKIFNDYEADEMTRNYYGVRKIYSICLPLKDNTSVGRV